MLKSRVSYFTLVLLLVSLPVARIAAQSTASYGVVVTPLSTTSAGAVTGTSFAVPSTYSAIITWQIVADGSAQTTILEGSLDNSTWSTIDTNTAATGSVRSFGFTGIKFVRISQTSRTGGTATTGTLVTSRGFITSGSAGNLQSLSLSGQMFASPGTLAAPGYSFNGFTGTGLNLSTSNRLEFGFAGATAGYISSNGWVVHGNATPIIYIGNALDMSIARAAAGEITVPAVAFASLGTPANGTSAYCSDCTPVTAASCPATKASCICAGAGVGSWAFRANSVWYCPF